MYKRTGAGNTGEKLSCGEKVFFTSQRIYVQLTNPPNWKDNCLNKEMENFKTSTLPKLWQLAESSPLCPGMYN